MLRKLRDDEQGFTLIELLVVILIVGILAAIALPTFLGQQKKGQDASAKSDARNAVSQIESCFTDTQNVHRLLELDLAAPAPAGAAVGHAGDQRAERLGNGDRYTVTATSKSGNSFMIIKNAGGSYAHLHHRRRRWLPDRRLLVVRICIQVTAREAGSGPPRRV